MEAARLTATIDADSKEGEEGLKRFHGLLGNAADGFKTLLATAGGFALGGGILEGIGKIGDFFSDAVREGAQANEGIAQTEAVLKSTGGAAGVTAQQVDDLSTKYMNMTGIQDDTVRSSENMLLTFTNIKDNVFPQATKTVLDMSVALGQDTKSSAIQLGKALNDPEKGLTALQRVGVTFTAQQKEQIKTMQQHGDMAGAQGVILAELNKEFGGSAEAAGKANGGIKILTAQFDNMKQSIGQAIIPILVQLMTAVQPLVAWIGDHLPGAVAAASEWFGAHLAPLLQQLASFVQTDVLPVIGQLAEWFEKKVVPAVQLGAAWFEKNLLPTLQQLGSFIITNVVPVLMKLAEWIGTHVVPVAAELAAVIVQKVVPYLENLWKNVSEKLIPALQHLWDKISPVLIPIFQALGDILNNVVGPALGIIIDVISHLIDLLTTIIEKIGDFLGVLGNVKDAVGNGLGWLGDHLGLGGGQSHAAGTQFHDGGPFLGAEQGPELLLTPGMYTAPRGSTVLNARDTQKALSGGMGGGGTTVNIYPQKADLDADDLQYHLRRVALLGNTGGGY